MLIVKARDTTKATTAGRAITDECSAVFNLTESQYRCLTNLAVALMFFV